MDSKKRNKLKKLEKEFLTTPPNKRLEVMVDHYDPNKALDDFQIKQLLHIVMLPDDIPNLRQFIFSKLISKSELRIASELWEQFGKSIKGTWEIEKLEMYAYLYSQNDRKKRIFKPNKKQMVKAFEEWAKEEYGDFPIKPWSDELSNTSLDNVLLKLENEDKDEGKGLGITAWREKLGEKAANFDCPYDTSGKILSKIQQDNIYLHSFELNNTIWTFRLETTVNQKKIVEELEKYCLSAKSLPKLIEIQVPSLKTWLLLKLLTLPYGEIGNRPYEHPLYRYQRIYDLLHQRTDNSEDTFFTCLKKFYKLGIETPESLENEAFQPEQLASQINTLFTKANVKCQLSENLEWNTKVIPPLPWETLELLLNLSNDKSHLTKCEGDNKTYSLRLKFDNPKARNRFHKKLNKLVTLLKCEELLNFVPEHNHNLVITTGDSYKQTTFLIITTLQEECDALLNQLPSYKKLGKNRQGTYADYVAELITREGAVYQVVIAHLGKQNQQPIAIETLLKRWQPNYVFLVGIVAGIREKVNLGNVIIAKQIAYSSEPKAKTVIQRLKKLLRHIFHQAEKIHRKPYDVEKNFSDAIKDKREQIFSGVIASIDDPVNNQKTLNAYHKEFDTYNISNVIGFETESIGAITMTLDCRKTETKYFMIRVVSHFAGEKVTKLKELHSYCEKVASDTIALLEEGTIFSQRQE